MSEQERNTLQVKLRDLEALYAAGYRFAARNQSGELRAYKEEPYKETISGTMVLMEKITLSHFNMICSIC